MNRKPEIDSRVRLDANVFLILSEFAQLNGKTKSEVAGEAIRGYIRQHLSGRGTSDKASRVMEAYFHKRISQLEQELEDLHLHAQLSSLNEAGTANGGDHPGSAH